MINDNPQVRVILESAIKTVKDNKELDKRLRSDMTYTFMIMVEICEALQQSENIDDVFQGKEEIVRDVINCPESNIAKVFTGCTLDTILKVKKEITHRYVNMLHNRK